MAFQITGKLLDIGEIIQRTDKFSTRDIILLVEKFYKKEDKSYPLKFQAINNKCMEMDSLNIKDALRLGLNVMVNFELTGREGKDGNVWNSLTVLSIIPSDSQPKILQQASIFIPESRSYADAPPKGEAYDLKTPFAPVSTEPYNDDLPF